MRQRVLCQDIQVAAREVQERFAGQPVQQGVGEASQYHGLHDNIIVLQHIEGSLAHPKHSKKNGGIRVHTVIRAMEDVPYLVRLTSAAPHGHCLLNDMNLQNGQS